VEGAALIRWLRPEEGGRDALPPGPEFRATGDLPDQSLADMNVDWDGFSLIVSWDGEASSTEERSARIRALVDDALTEPGQRFRVKEGGTPVAVGRIVSIG
jgi:hypothetical protein